MNGAYTIKDLALLFIAAQSDLPKQQQQQRYRDHDPYLHTSSELKLGWHQESSRVTRRFSR